MNKTRNQNGFHAAGVLIAVFVIAAIGLIGYKVYQNNSDKNTPSKSSALNSAKPQYASDGAVSGYITYDPAKFKKLETIGLPDIKNTDPNVNVVIVAANVVGYGDSGLYLYDLKTNSAYKLTSGGGDPRIMSDHFLVYGFDEDKDGQKQLGAKLLDLNTGETRTIFAAAPEKVSGNICCSVSPDGYKLALAQKDKISVWDIRSNSSKDYPVSLSPVADDFSRKGASYNVEMNYPTPVWADNDSVVYANKPATKPVNAGGATTHEAVDANVFVLNLSNGKIGELPTGKTGINTLYVRGGTNFVEETELGSLTPNFASLTLDSNKPSKLITPVTGFSALSPGGDKLYSFGLMHGTSAYQVINTNTNEQTNFNPVPTEITSISQIIPQGWIGQDRIILQVLDTAGNPDHEYVAIYNTSTDKVEQYTKIN